MSGVAGRPRDVVGRRWVFDLLRAGESVARIAALTGVSDSAIYLWRAQVGGVIRQRVAYSPRFLDREERYEIARQREDGIAISDIARSLARDRATIGRELARNSDPRTGRYQPERADSLARSRQARPKLRRIEQYPPLREWVQHRLDKHDSPQQIAGRLVVQFPDDDRMRLSHESIYQAIYIRGGGQLRRELRAHLRTNREHRRPRATRIGQGQIRDAVSIHDRPGEIEERLIPGHHEGDLIMGSRVSNSAIGTIVERTTGFLTLLHLPGGTHTAEQVADAVTRASASQLLPATWWQTLTWDRGKEMSQHARITAETGIKVYFADPHSPWQRGSNENMNGLLRQYFPKGTDLSSHGPTDLQAVADELNDRPRKRHGYRTPNEVMANLIHDNQNPGVATIT
jgi:IS30 family transposase